MEPLKTFVVTLRHDDGEIRIKTVASSVDAAAEIVCRAELAPRSAVILAREVRKVARRKPGTCEDCGWTKPVRTVHFWVNNMPYRVCKECEKPYRRRICWPVTVTP